MADLHVVKQGTGPMVVLSHALGCDLTMWDEVAGYLQTSYTVLRYDQCGHGRSPPQAGHNYTVEAYADEAAELISQHSEGPRDFCRFGHGRHGRAAIGRAPPAVGAPPCDG
jgi:3-oxoadipate enol-lactonase